MDNTVEKLLNINEYKRHLFKQHFLKGVIVEFVFDFNINDYIWESNRYKHYKEYVDKLGFSKLDEITNTNFSVSIKDEEPKITKEDEKIGINYENPNNGNKIQIIKDKLVFVNIKYEKFEVLVDSIKSFLSLIDRKYTITKIGYRKINSFILKDVKDINEITEYFNDNLFPRLKNNFFNFDVLDIYRDNLVLVKDKTKHIFNTSCARFPQIHNSYEIVIDNDIIYSDKVEFADLFKVLSDINVIHFDTFSWMISKKLANILNEKKA